MMLRVFNWLKMGPNWKSFIYGNGPSSHEHSNNNSVFKEDSIERVSFPFTVLNDANERSHIELRTDPFNAYLLKVAHIGRNI
jgi:hypothetical protein